MSPELTACVTRFIYFLDLLWFRYNTAKFHHCEIYNADSSSRQRVPLPSAKSPKKS